MSIIDKETTQKVLKLTNTKPNQKKLEDLLKDVRNFNDRMASTAPTLPENNVQFKRQQELNISDDEIKKSAEAELYDYKTLTEQGIQKQAEEKEKQLQSNRQTLQENYQGAKEQADNYYTQVKEDASNDALKRGLARSSIVINKLDAFNDDQLNYYNTLNKQVTENLNEIDFQLNSLNSEQQQALSQFDIEYAAKLNKKISDLKKEQTDIQNDIIKYNNQIAEAEGNFNIKYAQLEKELENARWDKDIDMIGLQGKYGATILERYKNDQIYNMIANFVATLPNDEMVDVLTNNKEIRTLLTKEQRDRLLGKF